MAEREDDILGADDVGAVAAVDPEQAVMLEDKTRLEDGKRRQLQMEEVRGRKNAFTRVLRDGGASLDDIAIVRKVLDRFCRKHTTTFHADPRLHAAMEGRREVILHVDDYIELSVDDLLNKLA